MGDRWEPKYFLLRLVWIFAIKIAKIFYRFSSAKPALIIFSYRLLVLPTGLTLLFRKAKCFLPVKELESS